MNICFFFGSNNRSGANLSLLRHALFLHGRGHRISVVFQFRDLPKSMNFLAGTEVFETWYQDEYPSSALSQDVVVTNWWPCAYNLHNIPARLYVFYRHGDEKALYQDRVFDAVIDAIFREKFLWFCVSDFLAVELVEAGNQPVLLPNGVDFARFASAQPSLPPKTSALRILIEGSASSPWKRIDATVDAIRGVDGVEIVHMSADGTRPATQVNFALGAIDPDATAGIYASCDLILKLSATESFAMPVLEQFAAGGTAVVTSFTGFDQYIDASNAIVVDIDQPFEAAATNVAMLRDNPRHLTELRASASATASRFDWLPLQQRFADILEQAVRERDMTIQRLPIIERYLQCQNEISMYWGAEQERRRRPPELPAVPSGTAEAAPPSARTIIHPLRKLLHTATRLYQSR